MYYLPENNLQLSLDKHKYSGDVAVVIRGLVRSTTNANSYDIALLALAGKCVVILFK